MATSEKNWIEHRTVGWMGAFRVVFSEVPKIMVCFSHVISRTI